MRRIRYALLGLAVATALGGAARASDLLEVYNQAKGYDSQYAAAQAALAAGKEKYPQGLAGLLPNIAGSVNTFWNRAENVSVTPNNLFTFNSNGWTVQLTQPLFRWQNWEAYKQGELQVVQAEATFGAAAQDLIVRVAQAYFDVLEAEDNLAFVKANKAAIAEQLAQAKRNFEVGTATITDTREAQARYDLVIAQEIVATGQFLLTVNHVWRIKPGNVQTAVMAGKAAVADGKCGTVIYIIFELFCRLIMAGRTGKVLMLTPGHSPRNRHCQKIQ